MTDGSVWTGTADVFDGTNKVRITDTAGSLVVILDAGAYQSQPQMGIGMGM
jgi:hypothetical protein